MPLEFQCLRFQQEIDFNKPTARTNQQVHSKRKMSEIKEEIIVMFAQPEHAIHAQHVCDLIYESAQQRKTGIARRSPEYISQKICSGKAVVALKGDRLIGFSYIECWEHGDYVATSGLIVDPEFRHLGLAARIKEKTFELARTRFPFAKIFSITTSLPVMKLNTRLGYRPVTFTELTCDDEYWKGCEGCVNYDILTRNERRMCLCTGMLYDPQKPEVNNTKATPYLMILRKFFSKLFHLKK